jgi:hypothetical protein
MPERYRIAWKMMQVSYSVGTAANGSGNTRRAMKMPGRNISETSIENSLHRGKMGSGGQDIVDDRNCSR